MGLTINLFILKDSKRTESANGAWFGDGEECSIIVLYSAATKEADLVSSLRPNMEMCPRAASFDSECHIQLNRR